MIQPARPNRAAEPKPQPEPKLKPKTVAQQKADFTAEGAPAPDPAFPDAPKSAAHRKTMPFTPAPHAGALGQPLSRSRL